MLTKHRKLTNLKNKIIKIYYGGFINYIKRLIKMQKINPNYIVGFIDGEGSFNITISKDIKRSSNHRVVCEMHITQNIHSIKVLETIRDYFDCGIIKVDNNITNTMKYQVNSYKDIANKIIPFFDKYPLLTSKYLNYMNFKEAINMMIEKEHLMTEGIIKMQDLANKMNKKRSFSEKFNFTTEHLIKHLINPDWISGFVDGEGCFYFYIGKQKNTTIQLQASLEIAQNTHDILILNKIKEFLGCGRLKPSLPINLEIALINPSISRLIISNPTDIKNKIIPFFDNYSLKTTKLLDYLDWKKLIEMKEKKYHLSEEGLNEMRKIKLNMNTNRKF